MNKPYVVVFHDGKLNKDVKFSFATKAEADQFMEAISIVANCQNFGMFNSKINANTFFNVK